MKRMESPLEASQPIGASTAKIGEDQQFNIPSGVSISPLRGRALLWCAWMELNSIRARDGVPRDYNGHKVGVSEEYFSALVDAIADNLGPDANPWPAHYMKPYIPSSDAL